MRRRTFLAGGVALAACRPWTRSDPRDADPTPHELATLAAIADTFLPGGDGRVGAHEVNTLGVLVHPAYGLRPYVAQVVADLDDWVRVTHGFHTFVELSPHDRERVLEERMGLRGAVIRSWYLPVYEGILALTKLAYVGAVANALGTSDIGFPGPSTGYAAESAAGAYTSSDPARAIGRGLGSTITVAGPGLVRAAQLAVFATTNDDARATLRITAPDQRHDDVVLHVAGGDAVLDGVALRLAGGPAAGAWRLDVVAHAGGAATLALWQLRIRTDLDG